jgi:hypothetical protein
MKKCLNREGHQFLKYQQKEQSPLTSTEHKKRRRHMTL